MNHTLLRAAGFSHWCKHPSGPRRGHDTFSCSQLASRCTLRNQNHRHSVSLSLQDENGVNRPVCSYVRVLRASRLLESPRQAARFVSLLAHEKAPVVGGGGGKQEQWCTLMSFLCRGKVRARLGCDVLMKVQ